MKFFILNLTFFGVVVLAKKSCYPVTDPATPPGLSNKPCPDRPYSKENFDVEALAGDWYVVKAYPNNFERGMSCLRYTFVPTGPYQYDVTFCEKFNGTHSCMTAQIDHINQDGKFTFVIPNIVSTIGYFLYVDYDNYYIPYECINLEDGKSLTSLWIVSRTPILSDFLLDEAYERIEHYFNENGLKSVVQDEDFCAA